MSKLREILSITGKPGLYKIVSQGKNMLLVEELVSGKRIPAHSRDKIVSLGDIAMYTDSGDLPLDEILDRLYEVQAGKAVDIKAVQEGGKLRDVFASVIPDFDRERVHVSDIKKLFAWYNLLIEAGFTKFAEEKTTDSAEE
jgi:hypothetical protein